MKKQNRILVETACSIARKTGAKGVLISAAPAEEYEVLASIGQERKIAFIVAVRNSAQFEEVRHLFHKILRIPDIPLGRVNQIKMSILQALTRGLITHGDRWVFLSGIPQAKTLDSILLLEFGSEFEILYSSDLPVISSIALPEVFDVLLGLALEISSEGKEGRKPSGTIFVLGKHEEVLKYSHPMVFNPFQGYPEEERNILDVRLKETMKTFSAIDGAFIIREDGVVLAAGRHIDVAGENLDIPLGLGSRHRAAAGITSLTDALAIVISEETGEVRIFHHGKIFMAFEKGD